MELISYDPLVGYWNFIPMPNSDGIPMKMIRKIKTIVQGGPKLNTKIGLDQPPTTKNF